MKTTTAIVSTAIAALAANAAGGILELDFAGNGGSGLLPGNEVGANTADSDTSNAIGGEVGGGLTYDDATNVLSFDFEFSGLNGGLFDAASGIHFHIAAPGVDPLNETGGIAYNLNSGTDANVSLSTPLVAIGASSGRVTGTANILPEDVADLLAGNFYLNIHSGDFTGGELRGNIVPAPGAAGVLALAGAATLRRRR
ncbi:MAG: CHRD domain-containing protein [Planctomycetota bacterium]